MKNKGFTLIELLAVIVILAIIALIATPTILNIIEESRLKANKISIDNYARAIRNGASAYHLREGKEVNAGHYTKANPLPFDPEYEGDITCKIIEIYEDGGVYVEGCTVNDTLVDYSSGTKQEIQIYKPQYYSWGNSVESSKPPTEKNVYIGLDGTNLYVCFIRNETEYCLKGADTTAYETNKTVLEEAFSDLDDACSFGDDKYRCDFDGSYVNVTSKGYISVLNDNHSCIVEVNGSRSCA